MDKNRTYFLVPDARDRQNAIGSLAGVPIKIKKAVTAIQNSFKPIDPPKQNDWLWDHEEYGQPYELYKSAPDKRLFDKESQNTIYIQPLEENIGFNQELKKFCKAFFPDCKVKVRQVINIQDVEGVQRRINEYSQQLQLNSRDILTYLRLRLPKDAICMIAVTKVDLFPSDDWNFVYGMGSLIHGVGVFSFNRYLYENDDIVENQLADKDTVVYRACKIMVHEISHMFGLKHCIYFSCLMNGQNHQQETYKTPLELCVVCVRKLQSNIGFSFIDRYQALIDYCQGKPLFSENDLPVYQNLQSLIQGAYGIHYQK